MISCEEKICKSMYFREWGILLRAPIFTVQKPPWSLFNDELNVLSALKKIK